MICSKLLVGSLVVSGSASSCSSAPVVSRSRKVLVTKSQKRFSKQQNKKRRRNRKLKRKLGIGVEFDLRKSKGKEGGFFAKDISFDDQNSNFGGVISGILQILNYTEEQEIPKGPKVYTKEEQQKTRDKVFKQRADEIVAKYKRPENVGYSPDRELAEFKVVNDAIELLVATTFTESEKSEVKNRLRSHGCYLPKYLEENSLRLPMVLGAMYSWADAGTLILFTAKTHFYFGGLGYCVGFQTKYPNGSDSTGPKVDVARFSSFSP